MTCKRCSHTGVCKTCKGEGLIKPGGMTNPRKCPECNGSRLCQTCKGKG